MFRSPNPVTFGCCFNNSLIDLFLNTLRGSYLFSYPVAKWGQFWDTLFGFAWGHLKICWVWFRVLDGLSVNQPIIGCHIFFRIQAHRRQTRYIIPFLAHTQRRRIFHHTMRQHPCHVYMCCYVCTAAVDLCTLLPYDIHVYLCTSCYDVLTQQPTSTHRKVAWCFCCCYCCCFCGSVFFLDVSERDKRLLHESTSAHEPTSTCQTFVDVNS